MDAEGLVVTEDLEKQFNGVEALKGVNLQFPEGVSGLVGPNGAGKTTFVRILLGLLPQDAGKAWVMGFDTASDSLAIRRKLGVLHERVAFPSFMNPRKYLQRVASVYDTDIDCDELLSRVDLDVGDKRIRDLSAGMQKKLAIAQALVGDPELVILDEPLSNLDVSARKLVSDLIIKLHNEEGISFLISSHILSDLEKVCHYVAFLDNGNVIEQDSVQNILQRYTADRYRIVVSDPPRMVEQVRGISEVEHAEVAGANSLVMTAAAERIDAIWEEIQDISKSLSVQAFSFHRENTLEEAFKELVN
ncbi:MAG: ABC transporter ATP-binding protein [Promethearchaeia archaeon]